MTIKSYDLKVIMKKGGKNAKGYIIKLGRRKKK